MTDLPDALKALGNLAQWVCWDNVNGRKIPRSPHGGNAKANDRSTWGTLDEAIEAADSNGYTGLGIELDGGLVGIDLDDCVHDGKIEQWAQDIVDSIDSYTEISPSGTGIHIICGASPERTGAIGRANHAKGLEIYNHGRYFTVTGKAINDRRIRYATDEVMKLVSDEFPERSAEDSMKSELGRLAKNQVARRANDTVMDNVKRDRKSGVRFARVPMGNHTCAFCTMLASRGFIYWSEETAGAFAHWHADCRCKVVPGVPEIRDYWKNGVHVTRGFDTSVEGYDPDSLFKQWKAFEKIEAMQVEPAEKRALRAFVSSGLDLSFIAGRAVGAKAATDYVVHMPSGHDTVFFPGSEIEVKKVFAGRGSSPSKELRVAQRLADEYGGQPEEWSHVAGEGWIFDPDDNGRIALAEVHWMEHPDIGRQEFYFKRWARRRND